MALALILPGQLLCGYQVHSPGLSTRDAVVRDSAHASALNLCFPCQQQMEVPPPCTIAWLRKAPASQEHCSQKLAETETLTARLQGALPHGSHPPRRSRTRSDREAGAGVLGLDSGTRIMTGAKRLRRRLLFSGTDCVDSCWLYLKSSCLHTPSDAYF